MAESAVVVARSFVAVLLARKMSPEAVGPHKHIAENSAHAEMSHSSRKQKQKASRPRPCFEERDD